MKAQMQNERNEGRPKWKQMKAQKAKMKGKIEIGPRIRSIIIISK